MKAIYYHLPFSDGELCNIKRIVTEKVEKCYVTDCGRVILPNTPAVQIQTAEGDYFLHKECALRSCNLKPNESGMRERLNSYLNDYHEQRVIVTLNKRGNLFHRIETFAADRGTSVEAVIDSLVSNGLTKLMVTNLDEYEQSTKD